MAARAGLRVAAVVAVWDAGEADAGAEAEAEADAEADGWFRLGGVSCPIIRRAACAGLNVGGDPALALALLLALLLLALALLPALVDGDLALSLPLEPEPSPPFVLLAFLADPPPPQIVSSVGVPAAASWFLLFRSFRPLPVPAMMIIRDRLIEPNSCILAPRDLC